MNTNMHGKSIDFIELNPAWTQGGYPERVVPFDGFTLSLSATHHGDHDQFWIVLRDRNGQEVERFNPRGIQHIVWSQVTQKGDV